MICRRCGTKFSVGAPYCPQCTATDAYPEGEDDMAKITRHGGVSDKDAGAEPSVVSADEESAGGVGAEAAPPRPAATPAKGTAKKASATKKTSS
jgi:hypothetical protein